jgi:hypothetical protein
MADTLTWAEFAQKYKPKDGDRFLDDRGAEWVFDGLVTFFYKKDPSMNINILYSGSILTCPLIPRKSKRKMFPALIKIGTNYELTKEIYETEQSAQSKWPTLFVSWPAVLNADGSYYVEEEYE